MTTPACSIVITNYNKKGYLAAAINSALSQTYRNLEVIVVDDGSNDGSATIIHAYHDKIKAIAKENGGQASAMNRGFAASSGDIVFFLDADDMLLADTVERVANTWKHQIAKVHFRLQQISADGRPIDGAFVPPYRALPSGDLSRMLRQFGFYPSPPTSGNAFSRGFLKQVMPIPEGLYRGYADTFLIGAAPLFGDVRALDGIGGYWRRHDGNLTSAGVTSLPAKLRGDLAMACFVSKHQSGGTAPRPVVARWPQHLKERLIVRKFAKQKTVGDGALIRTAFAYFWAIARWPEYSMSDRLRFAIWALVMMLVPRAVLVLIPGIAGRFVVDGG
jgi:Glycosyl transferase family 2